MTYALNGLIEASDYNILVSGSPDGVINNNVPNVNTILNGAVSRYGYGANTLPTKAPGQIVSAAEWQNLIDVINTIALHQNTQIYSMTIPSTGDLIEYMSAVSSNVEKLYYNSLNAGVDPGDPPVVNPPPVETYTVYLNQTPWKHHAKLGIKLFYGDISNAMQFFNLGGTINYYTRYQPMGTPPAPTLTGLEYDVDRMLRALTVQSGTLRMAAPKNGMVLLGHKHYHGINQIVYNYPGIVTDPKYIVLDKKYGYYGLEEGDRYCLTQQLTPDSHMRDHLRDYLKSSIRYAVRTNSRKDFIEIRSEIRLSHDANRVYVNGVGMQTIMTVEICYPSTTYLGNVSPVNVSTYTHYDD